MTCENQRRLATFFRTMAAELSNLPSANDPAVLRQVTRMRKRSIASSKQLIEKAVADFIDVNQLVRSTTVNLTVGEISRARGFILDALCRYTNQTVEGSIQDSFDVSYFCDNWRFGPGASNGVVGTHTVEKVSQNMSVTAPCAPFVKELRLNNPYFSVIDGEDYGCTVVEGSRLAVVPKNEDTMRTIAIEPSGNMAIQLSLGRHIEGSLRCIGFDITTQQPKNKLLARRGSFDGSLCTIDLKSASDMISIPLIRALLPPEWFVALLLVRCSSTTLPDGRVIKLNMVSTMGNGFTFPLMTLLISSLLYAASSESNYFLDSKEYGVFGDDVICPNDDYVITCDILTRAGFIVNYDKSFCDGPFRESCGGDYWHGRDITPFYARSLSTASSIYVVINQLLEWSGRHNVIPYRSLRFLLSLLDGKAFLIPEWYSPDQGILTSGVSGRFRYLSAKHSERTSKDGRFDYMLAVGGYFSRSDAHNKFYIPRGNPKYVVRKSRMPSGFLDSHDPLTRSRRLSSFISFLLDIALFEQNQE